MAIRAPRGSATALAVAGVLASTGTAVVGARNPLVPQDRMPGPEVAVSTGAGVLSVFAETVTVWGGECW